MFVINFKLNFKKIFTICLVLAVVSAVIIEFITSGYNIQSAATMRKDESKYDYILNDDNFIQILKQVHENIPASINKTIKMSGFVFRMDDFKPDIFVCGRNTIVNEEDTVAGFLCQSTDASKLKDSEWIEITGVIQEGTYNTTMPIIKIGSIKKITAPANTFVK